MSGRQLLIAVVVLLAGVTRASAQTLDARVQPLQGAVDTVRFTTNATNGAEQLPAKAGFTVLVQALCANTGNVEIGDSAVDASSVTDENRGLVLAPCGVFTFDVKNSNVLYVDSGTAAQGLRVMVIAGP